MDRRVGEDDSRSLGWHGLVGAIAVFGLFGGLILWAGAIEIAGAVVAGGTIVVESNTKSVQHNEGGTVREILARNGDEVLAGDLLVRLDDTVVAASLAVVVSQLHDSLVLEARLEAQAEGLSEFTAPPELPGNDANALESLATQARLLRSSAAARDGQIAQLQEQVVQLERQIDGLQIQSAAIDAQVEIMKQEQGELLALFSDNLVEASRVNAMRRSLAQSEGERGRLISNIAEARAAIAERRLQMTQVMDDYRSAALDQLQATRQALSEQRQQRQAAEQRLKETQIRAPQSGVVHQSIVHTVGGVVGAGEVLMLIVPQDDELLIEVHIDPLDVEKLHLGQDVTVRLPSLDQRTTPELHGTVATMSPDYVQDRATGMQYYTAKVRLSPTEIASLPPNISLRPGMPAEAFVTTEDRTVLTYLLHPIMEELNLAFRED